MDIGRNEWDALPQIWVDGIVDKGKQLRVERLEIGGLYLFYTEFSTKHPWHNGQFKRLKNIQRQIIDIG